MVERHAFVEVIGSSPILVLFYFLSILGKEIFKNVVKNLSLGDLELILCDWYEMDEQLPNPIFEKKQASLMSAYAMLNESYKQYRKAAKTVYGEDADDKIHAEMAKDAMVSTYDWGYQVYNMDMDSDSERLLFYDLASKKYFRTTMAAVLNAQYHVNRNLSVRGVCPLNEYLSFLGLDEVDGGDVIGWDICYMIEEMDCYWLDFDNHKTTLEDGLECIIIDTMALSKFE